MAERYPVHEIEARWRETWQQTGINTPDLDRAERPFYNLVEFPYPSGEGLHVGHVYTYCGADAYGRLRRMQGWDVFQPFGFDAFGIHSENYALKLHVHPAELLPVNIRRFREEQLLHLGCAFDWTRTVDTSSPAYYRWTQWLFLKMLEAGLAYQAEAPVNWCPQDQTVLANEQVIDGRCERCGTPIVQRVMRQWFLRITDYAERLLDFSGVDFPEASVKRMTAWIGRSEGAEIFWPVDGAEQRITTFTTRPDTIFGATFVALAPEHPLVTQLCSAEQREQVAHYVAQTQRRLERERLVEQPKGGVWIGAYAVNPLDGRRVPVWVADYVLARYGSGAIMGVPAHDERDRAFAELNELPYEPGGRWKVEGGRSLDQVSESRDQALQARESLETFNPPPSTFDPIAVAETTARLQELGAGQPKVTYRLRDWLISRQRYWGPPIPIVHCDGCGAVPVPEDQLPVLLPHVDDVRPRGVSPLEAASDWIEVACPRCGGPGRREADVSDNFLDSSWYYLRYTSTEFHDRAWDGERVRRWLPIDQYAGGPEHTTMHHLYARFVCKALFDLGLVPFDEPFARLRLHGTITKDGAKMSKSRGNVVSPDGYIRTWGSDVFRMYMLFLGPWEEGGDFTDAGVAGVARFAGRVWEWVLGERPPDGDGSAGAEAERRRHRSVQRVEQAIDEQRFHVALAALMEQLNWLRENTASIDERELARSKASFVLALAPFAPHLCEELWARLGRPYSVHQQPWPEVDEALAAEPVIEIPVQVGGKLRERLRVPAGTDRAGLEQLALNSPRVQRAIDGRPTARIVVVPDRMVSIVLEESAEDGGTRRARDTPNQ